jgi:uncharacterized protein (TIGR02117 family)
MKYIFFLLFTLALTACSSLPHVTEPVQGDSAVIEDDIYVVSHGWHTGFVVPARLIQSRMPELKSRFGHSPYIEFGWGDKGFYQAEEITTGLTIRAIFWPTESVVHAVAVPGKANQYFPDSQVEKLCLNGHEYSSLIHFIENSFAKDKNGDIIKSRNGLYGDSQFYQGQGDYYLMNTCNKWTAKGLKSAGMDINPTFKLTADSVMTAVIENSRVLKNGGCPAPIK